MVKNSTGAFAILLVAATSACKTTQIVKVDETRGEMIIYANDDPATTMSRPEESTSLKDVEASLSESVKVAADPENQLIDLAQVQLVRGELDQAEGTARKVLRKNLKSEAAKIVLAHVYYRRGMLDMASIILDGIGGAKSKESVVLNLMGMIAIEKGENSRALALFNDAIRINSSDVAARMNLGVLYMKYHQLKEAAVQFERVLSMLPEHQDARVHMAAVLTSRGQYEEAEKMFKGVLASSENNPVAMYNYAVLQAELKEYDAAVSTLKDYLKVAEGKTVQTDRAFALITDIKRKMASDGKSISNEEIEELAKNLEQRDRQLQASRRTAKVERQPASAPENHGAAPTEPVPAKKSEGLAAKSGKKSNKAVGAQSEGNQPAKAAPERVKAEDENVDDLEKALLK